MDNILRSRSCQASVVVIPSYQPSDRLISLVNTLGKSGYYVIVVDDGSNAEYNKIWSSLDGCIMFHHKHNLGKGGALKTAFEYIRDYMPQVGCIVTMDADGQHLPDDMEHVEMSSWMNPDALILGARSFDREVPLRSKLGNKITRFIFSRISNKKITDTQTGLRAFQRKLLDFMIETEGQRYEYEMNVLLHCNKYRIPILEVPIKTVYLDKDNSCSHFKKFRDSFRIYRNILKFASASFISFLTDYFLFLLLSFLFPKTAMFIVVANIAARLISAALNYTLNTKAVFHDKQSMRKTLPQYILLAGTVLAGNSLILSLLISGMGLAPALAKIITEILLFLFSFFVQSFVIFKTKKNPVSKKGSRRSESAKKHAA